MEEESGLMIEKELHEYAHFPICKTNTGWFHCSTEYTHSEIDDELGLGISIYFKQLKALTIMKLKPDHSDEYPTGQFGIDTSWLCTAILMSGTSHTTHRLINGSIAVLVAGIIGC